MAILIGTNIKYEGPDFLDARKSVSYLSDLGNLDIELFPDGYEIFCNANKSWYVLNKSGTKDSTTGYFVKRSDTVYDNSKAELKDNAIISDFKTFINNAFPWVPKYSDNDDGFATSFTDVFELGSEINTEITNSVYRANSYYFKYGSITKVTNDLVDVSISYRITDLNGQNGGNLETLGKFEAVDVFNIPTIYHNFGKFTKPSIIEIYYDFKETDSNGGTKKEYLKTIVTDFFSSAGFIDKSDAEVFGLSTVGEQGPDKDKSRIYQNYANFEKTKATKFSKGYAEFDITPTEKGKYLFIITRPGVFDTSTKKENLRVFINNQLTTNFSESNLFIENKNNISDIGGFRLFLFDYPINSLSSINVKIEKI